MPHPEIIVFFFIVAFVYASVGFGGGSSYLAILAVYAFPIHEIRLIALLCNIIVVTGGTIVFIKSGQVNFRKILPVAITSVPMAFIGARVRLSQDTFFIILGISLIVAAILLWMQNIKKTDVVKEAEINFLRDGLLGGAIGFLSGMVGIGGGIFLSPLLNLMHWDTSKKIAATASVFILVNSIAGIGGLASRWPQQINYTLIIVLCGATLVGGQLGSRLGALKFNLLLIRRLTAVLVFAAGVEVLVKHLPSFK
jgi:uncharacterized membrane protein YfcA